LQGKIMKTLLLASIILIPITIGIIVIWLVFRRINNKYSQMFDKIISTAKENPENLKPLIDGSPEKINTILNNIAGIEKIIKIDILKAARELTQLHLTGIGPEEKQYTWYIELSRKANWTITEFSPIK